MFCLCLLPVMFTTITTNNYSNCIFSEQAFLINWTVCRLLSRKSRLSVNMFTSFMLLCKVFMSLITALLGRCERPVTQCSSTVSAIIIINRSFISKLTIQRILSTVPMKCFKRLATLLWYGITYTLQWDIRSAGTLLADDDVPSTKLL